MSEGCDAVVIGSGFGGAITACRLAENGFKTVVLERGRRWVAAKYSSLFQDRTPYPRSLSDPWSWSHERPEISNGWVDFRRYRHVSVIQGAGVGGGSLIYANVSAEAPAVTFESGWPPEIKGAELAPYYKAVAGMMGVQTIPATQWNPRTFLMNEAARKANYSKRFRLVPLAVSFDQKLTLDPQHPPNVAATRTFMNGEGIEQGYCAHTGECDIGCPVEAKNTLALNYIPRAERHGADVRPLHLVTMIEPARNGYVVRYDRIDAGRRVAGSIRARIIVVAAGAMASTELLLRCRDFFASLPKISRVLGDRWSSNGDFLTPALYLRRAIRPAVGPTISSAIDFHHQTPRDQRFWIQDGGLPHLLQHYFGHEMASPRRRISTKAIVASIHALLLNSKNSAEHIMPWFAQGVDAGDGRLYLKNSRRSGAPRMDLAWSVKKSKPLFDAIAAVHEELTTKTRGTSLSTWPGAQYLFTPHPLGGCIMGSDISNGVVNHRGEVFGYKHLFVADSSIIPTPLGVNPSRTIGALAERIARLLSEAV